ncbi:hypothetical protein RRG08_048346 [Elysia crispata]|uniref:DDE-1 domain-containing protein n=1 Tax=Elysia crispata TaxID=231223 RepID=A0AAE0YGI1_9GAST|nr:hypothetical protein RRG08_048346 [Elysia crispata]
MPRSWSEHGLAGQDWWLKFAERHQLTLRAPESTSLARASAFNKPVVNKFFSNLAKVMDEHKFSPNQIFNCDETGLTTVQKPKAVVAKRGTKQVGSITSQERGELVTVMYAVSASGNSIPPMMIFPRVNYRDHFIRGAPPGTIGCANPSGWMTKGLFIKFLDHLIQQTNCSVDRKVLLVMDNHETHMSLEAVDLARANGIIMLTIPPHTSHRLQPLDRTVYGPLKTAYNIAMDSWMRSNPGKNVTIYDIPELLRIAHNEALTPKNISSGFACTGIFPFNQTVFSDTDFAPSATTDNIVTVSGAADDGRGEEEPGPSDRHDEPGPSVCVRHNEQGPSDRRDEPGPSPRPYVSPADIRPFPKAIKPAKPTQRARKKRSTTILTSSPARAALFQESEIKKAKLGKPKREAKSKKSLFQSVAKDVSSSSESEFEFSDSSADDIDDTDEDVIEGDFVVVKVAGKSRIVNFIARVDTIDNDKYGGVFLRKVLSRMTGKPSFVIDNNDEALFKKQDILAKLPIPSVVGGSARRENQFTFSCNLELWNIN